MRAEPALAEDLARVELVRLLELGRGQRRVHSHGGGLVQHSGQPGGLVLALLQLGPLGRGDVRDDLCRRLRGEEGAQDASGQALRAQVGLQAVKPHHDAVGAVVRSRVQLGQLGQHITGKCLGVAP